VAPLKISNEKELKSDSIFGPEFAAFYDDIDLNIDINIIIGFQEKRHFFGENLRQS
jgi:hypothetical protein